MLEDIHFTDSGEKISITIDKEIQEIPIKKFNKLPTYIELNQSLNTALESDIQLNASIFYNKTTSQINNDENITGDNIPNENIHIDTEPEDMYAYLMSLEHDEDRISIDGSVVVTIYNGEEKYHIKDTFFKKGKIIDSIPNTLPLGNYLMTIEYPGSKYFEPCTLSVSFNIEKRLGKCTFKSERYYGDFLENIEISGILTDYEKDIPVSNCEITYDFDDYTDVVTTNNDGEFFLSITIPEPDKSHCIVLYDEIDEPNLPGALYKDDPEEEIPEESQADVYYKKDEDGNIIVVKKSDNEEINNDGTSTVTESSTATYYEEEPQKIVYYPNASYLIDFYTDNASYYLKDTQVEIIANKAPVLLTATSTNSAEVSNTVNIVGSALATYNQKDNDILYGEVSISLPDLHYDHPIIKVENGIFTTDINLIDAYNIYNQSDKVDITPEDLTQSINTNIVVKGTIYDENDSTSYVKVGEPIMIEAQVSSQTLIDYVPYGALLFTLENADEEIVYQYTTELDRTGTGILNLNTSTEGDYTIQVKYLEMFDYKPITSDKFKVKVRKNVI